MQSLGRRYVRTINAAQRRSGTLWEGRYRAAPIDSEPYFLACCRYIELNPVRAYMVAHPADYRWSSYRAACARCRRCAGERPPACQALGRGAAARQTAYRDLFQAALQPGFVDALRAATNGGWALGDSSFERQLADALRRRVTPLPRGRPRRERAAK
jgi:putative transposase